MGHADGNIWLLLIGAFFAVTGFIWILKEVPDPPDSPNSFADRGVKVQIKITKYMLFAGGTALFIAQLIALLV